MPGSSARQRSAANYEKSSPVAAPAGIKAQNGSCNNREDETTDCKGGDKIKDL